MRLWKRTAPQPPPAAPVTTALPADTRCTGTTVKGTRCKLEAGADGRCPFHPLEQRQDAR